MRVFDLIFHYCWVLRGENGLKIMVEIKIIDTINRNNTKIIVDQEEI